MTATLRRWSAVLTLVTFLGSLMVPMFMVTHARWDDDLACGSDVFAPGHQTASYQANTPSAAATRRPEHCAVCHWLRAMGSASASATVSSLFNLAPQPPTSATPFDRAIQDVAFQRTSRGPPALL